MQYDAVKVGERIVDKGIDHEQNDSLTRLGFILQNSMQFDWNTFILSMADEWSIQIDEQPYENKVLLFEHNNMNVCCSFADYPIPSSEVQANAKNNYLWKEALDVVSEHKAHIVLSVTNGVSSIERSVLFTKVATSLLRFDHATSIYQFPTVLSKKEYIDAAQDIKTGELPITDWVYFGLYYDGKKLSGYTYGLEYFGKNEVEVIHTKAKPHDLYGCLLSVATYVIQNDITLHQGETLGFTKGQKLKITRSKGIAVENDSIKVAF